MPGPGSGLQMQVRKDQSRCFLVRFGNDDVHSEERGRLGGKFARHEPRSVAVQGLAGLFAEQVMSEYVGQALSAASRAESIEEPSMNTCGLVNACGVALRT